MNLSQILRKLSRDNNIMNAELAKSVDLTSVELQSFMNGLNTCMSVELMVKLCVKYHVRICDLFNANNWRMYKKYNTQKVCLMCGELIKDYSKHKDCLLQIFKDSTEQKCISTAIELDKNLLGELMFEMATDLRRSEKEAYRYQVKAGL